MWHSFKCILPGFAQVLPVDVETEETYSNSPDVIEEKVQKANFKKFNLHKSTRVYVGGYLLRNVLKSVKQCKCCRKYLVGNAKTTNNVELLLSRQFTKTLRLKVPTNDFVGKFEKCNAIAQRVLPKICEKKGIQARLVRILAKHVIDWNEVCSKHNLGDVFLDLYTLFYIRVWCRNVNRVLRGKDVRDINDEIKQMALDRFQKFTKRGRAMAKEKGTQLF